MAYNVPELARQLRGIEERYLRSALTPDEKKKRELVSAVTETLILDDLSDILSGVAYTGSNYEYTTVPGTSDYDIQFYLKLNQMVTLESSSDGAWAYVRGGPRDMQTHNGYLSASEARRLIQSRVDQALAKYSLKFQGDPVTIRRSVSGPATTLNVSWRRESLSIDIVACVKADNVSNSDHDLVGKPNSQSDGLWRFSFSIQERDKLRDLYTQHERAITLLRIMKVIKTHNSQLNHYPSYFYKNLLFKLLEDNRWANWDTRDSLAERFVDMIKLMRDVLKAKYMPLHFKKSINYLQGANSYALDQTAAYLGSIINNGHYYKLIPQ